MKIKTAMPRTKTQTTLRRHHGESISITGPCFFTFTPPFKRMNGPQRWDKGASRLFLDHHRWGKIAVDSLMKEPSPEPNCFLRKMAGKGKLDLIRQAHED
jgi:hypothetical protein